MSYCERCGYPVDSHGGSIPGIALDPASCIRVMAARLRLLEAKLLAHIGAAQ